MDEKNAGDNDKNEEPTVDLLASITATRTEEIEEELENDVGAITTVDVPKSTTKVPSGAYGSAYTKKWHLNKDAKKKKRKTSKASRKKNRRK